MTLTVTESRCPNCSAELTHEYCAECGQRRIHPEDLSARRFVRELPDEIASLHSKLKILVTLRGLLQPGFLTAEHLAGRRRRHLRPVQLYLVCAAIFFLAAPWAGFTLAAMVDADASGVLERLIAPHVAASGLERSVFNARFDVRVQTVYTIIFGAGAVIIAAVLQGLFRRKRWPYGAHLIFALHYMSFLYLVTLAAGASRAISVPTPAGVGVGYVIVATYLALALKRVYEETNGRTLLKAAVLVLVTMLFNNAANTAAIRLTLALV